MACHQLVADHINSDVLVPQDLLAASV